MDSQQRVCLFFQRTGTCKLGETCPLSHTREQRGITTKYNDRIWLHAQVTRAGKGFVILRAILPPTVVAPSSRLMLIAVIT